MTVVKKNLGEGTWIAISEFEIVTNPEHITLRSIVAQKMFLFSVVFWYTARAKT